MAFAAGRRLQPDRVGAMRGLGEAEGPQLLHPRHRREPLLFLLLATQHLDGAHRKPRVDPEEGIEAAVTPCLLYGHKTGGHVAYSRAAVALYRGARDVQLGDLGHQLERELGLVPVLVDYGDDLPVCEGADLVTYLTLLVRKELLDEVVVGP